MGQMGLKERSDLPPVDEHFMREGMRFEALHGRVLMTPPAQEPHGRCHAELAYLLKAHITPEYRVAVDMLTRTSKTSDFAPDASVYPAARHPVTGGRQLEELAFEVVARQWIGIPSEKARELIRRGVRRVFALVVKSNRLMEWSTETDAFSVVPVQSQLDDRCFVRPLPVRAILEATATDDAVVAALRARGALGRIESEARCEGLRAAVQSVAAILEVSPSPEQVESIASADEDALRGLLSALQRERRWPDATPR